MLKSEPSFASLLVKQSPGMHYGHGWIAGKGGKRWHPSRSQADLLAIRWQKLHKWQMVPWFRNRRNFPGSTFTPGAGQTNPRTSRGVSVNY